MITFVWNDCDKKMPSESQECFIFFGHSWPTAENCVVANFNSTNNSFFLPDGKAVEQSTVISWRPLIKQLAPNAVERFLRGDKFKVFGEDIYFAMSKGLKHAKIIPFPEPDIILDASCIPRYTFVNGSDHVIRVEWVRIESEIHPIGFRQEGGQINIAEITFVDE